MEVISRRKKKPERNQPDEDDLPTKIEVDKSLVERIVPGSVWRAKSFKWNPLTFVTESEQLNSKFMESTVQDKSLQRFIDDPVRPQTYAIGGNPDDVQAKYFAAYLMGLHMKALKGHANPMWATIYGGFDNPFIDKEKGRPSIIVMTNLTLISTNQKLEKARDTLEYYADIPRIVINVGIDPISFFATKLFLPVNGIAYFADSLIKRAVEVI